MATGPVIDSASVEITAELSRFTSEVQHGIDRQLRESARHAQREVQVIERSFDQLASSIRNDMHSIQQSIDSAATQSSREMRTAANMMHSAILQSSRSSRADFERLEDAFSQVATSIEHQSREMGRVLEQSMQHSTAQAADSAEMNLGQMGQHIAGMFDGMIQRGGTFSSILAGLGPAGIAAGAAVGLGIGGVMGVVRLATRTVTMLTQKVMEFGQEFIRTGITTAAEWEVSQLKFVALTKSAKEGTKIFKELKEFAAFTPYELGDILPAATRYLAFAKAVGMSNDQLKQYLTITGGIASLLGENGGNYTIQQMAMVFGQIASKGKLAYEEVMQLSEALPGYSGVAAIAAYYGISNAEAQAKMAKGAIDAKTGVKILLDSMQKFPGVADAMEKQSRTLSGMWSTLMDRYKEEAASFVDPFIPAIKKGIDWLSTTGIDKAKTALYGIGNFFLDVSEDAREYLAERIPGYVTGLKNVFDEWYDVILENKGTIRQAFKDGARAVDIFMRVLIGTISLGAEVTDTFSKASLQFKTDFNNMRLKALDFGLTMLKVANAINPLHPFDGLIKDLEELKEGAEDYKDELNRAVNENAAGRLEAQARKLRREIERKKKANIDTADSRRKLIALQNQINRLRNKSVKIYASTGSAYYAVSRLKSSLASLQRTYYVTIGARTTGGVSGYAKGGIPMPNTPFMVGEEGPEVASYDPGSRTLNILNTSKSKAYVSNITSGGTASQTNTFNITVNTGDKMDLMQARTIGNDIANTIARKLDPQKVAAATTEGRRQLNYVNTGRIRN